MNATLIPMFLMLKDKSFFINNSGKKRVKSGRSDAMIGIIYIPVFSIYNTWFLSTLEEMNEDRHADRG
jgi:hypothetical protein